MPLLTGYIIDVVLRDHRSRELDILCSALVGLTIFNLGIGFVSDYILHRIQKDIARGLSVEMLRHLQTVPLATLSRSDPGYWQARVLSDANQMNNLLRETFDTIVHALTLLAGLSAIFFLNVRLALLSVLVVPLFALSFYINRRQIQQLESSLREQHALTSGTVAETFQAPELCRLYGLGPRRSRRLRSALITDLRLSLAHFRSQRSATVGVSFFAALGSLLVVWLGGHEAIAGRLTIGQLVAFSALLSFLYGPTRSLIASRLSILSAQVSLSRVSEILALPQEDPPELPRMPAPCRPSEFTVVFEGVSFAYDAPRTVLHDITLTIEDGESLALLGPTGSGKSTLVKLLAGLHRPTRGSIRVGGCEITDISTAALRSCLGFIPQEPFLYRDSVFENIRLGKPGATRAEVLDAARKTNIFPFIMALPAGFETRVGSGGLSLSGGQRQLVCIARAMLRDAPILVLDEPTSAVDSKTEAMVRDALRAIACGRTIITISHRLATIVPVDRYVVLEAGTITDSGTHLQLLGRNSFYRDVALAQHWN